MYNLIICLLGTYVYLLVFSFWLLFNVWKCILLDNYMVFMKKIFNHVLFLSFKTFRCNHMHGYKNMATHKNMAYMIVWLEMVINHICHSHKCEVVVYCYYSPYIIVAYLGTHLIFPYCCSFPTLQHYCLFFTLRCYCLLVGCCIPPPPLLPWANYGGSLKHKVRKSLKSKHVCKQKII